MTNLLANAGFEADWGEEESHRCLVFPESGGAFERIVDNIFTPPCWMTWFRHDPDTWDQPEVRDAWKHHDPNRVHSGEKGILLFTFGRRHDAGFLQVVDVEPGQRLRATVWGHAWSNHIIPGYEGCFDDGGCSCGTGTGPGFWWEDEVPELNRDQWNDAKQNFLLAIGIDPTGGTDPYSDTVVWGRAAYIYNVYAQLEVEATAQADQVTMFLRSTTQWGFKHNDAYWDNAELKVVDDSTPPSYKSTMLVLPQNATPDQLHEIFTLAYPNRRTFGFSHDDAGSLNGTAILYNILAEEKLAFLVFYTARYPNVAVEFAYTSDWEEPPDPPSELLLWQCDPRWKYEKVASPDCFMTLCQTGCWISACAMAQRFFNIRPDATPSTANQALGTAGGFSGCLTLWSGMKTALGLEVVKKTVSDTEAQAWLDTGNIGFAEVEPETYLHFVLVTRHEAGRFWMHDPYKNVEGWLDEHYSGAESWRLIRPFDPGPPSPPPPVPPPPIPARKTRGHLGGHFQTMIEGWRGLVPRLIHRGDTRALREAMDGFMTTVRPSVIKVLASMEDVKGAARACADTLRVWRHVENNTGGIFPWPDPHEGARRWIAMFRSGLDKLCNEMAQEFPHLDEPYCYVEPPNEIYNSDYEIVRQAAALDRAFCIELTALGLPVKPIAFTAAVGNPHHKGKQYELLVDLARVCVETGGMFGYHAYWLANQEYGGPDYLWKYLAGRWTEIDDVLRAHGVHNMRWFFGECGGVGGTSGNHPDGSGWVNLNAGAGWLHSECYNGNWPRYLTDLMRFDELVAERNAKYGDYVVGGTIFTSGAPYCGWPWFQIQERELRPLAAALVERYPM